MANTQTHTNYNLTSHRYSFQIIFLPKLSIVVVAMSHVTCSTQQPYTETNDVCFAHDRIVISIQMSRPIIWLFCLNPFDPLWLNCCDLLPWGCFSQSCPLLFFSASGPTLVYLAAEPLWLSLCLSNIFSPRSKRQRAQ